MIQEDKELLLKDLSARLPYKPIVQITDCGIWNLRGIDHDDSAELRDRVIVWKGKYYPSSQNSFPIINCKLYLFPLSSMTEEQKEEYYSLADDVTIKSIPGRLGMRIHCIKLGISDNPHEEVWDYVDLDAIDWLNKNHFDYRGLIKKGLVIDATGLNIY